MVGLSTLTLRPYDQMLGGLANVLRATQAACESSHEEEAAFITAKLAPDMLDFSWQVQCATTNSVNALKGALQGRYELDLTQPPNALAGLSARVAEARAALSAVDPASVDALAGKEVLHVPRKVVFTAEDFLFGFSLPNFYFHLTTAYAIMRAKGVQIGKKDYLGRLRVHRRNVELVSDSEAS